METIAENETVTGKPTAEELNTWRTYKCPHVTVMEDLGITKDALPTELKNRLKGMANGQQRVGSQKSFEAFLDTSTLLGDDIITWSEREIPEDKQEPEPPKVAAPVQQQAAPVQQQDDDEDAGCGMPLF